MAKINEKKYFASIGDAGVTFSLNKPYADRVSAGCLMSNVASIASLLRNNFGMKDLRILDIGCGSGWTSNQFALMGHDVTGVDIAPEAIAAAKKTFSRSNLRYIESDYDKIVTDDKETYDVALFIDSLHHSDSLVATLKAAKKTLNKGGVCIVCEPGRGHSKSPDAIEAVEKYGVTEADLPPVKIIKAAKSAGFKRYKTYASPALMHRALYWEYDTVGIKKIIKYNIIRLASTLTLYLLKNRKEGLVVLYN